MNHMLHFRYENNLVDSKAIVAKAHLALEAQAWRRGIPNLKIRGENNPAKRPENRAKISAAKTENNWMTGRTGSLHHLYLGGKIWWRGKDWDATKLRVRMRDAFMCAECDITEVQHLAKYGQPLQVHHIIPYRISHDNSPRNLITLCSYHHGKKKLDENALIEDARLYLPVAA